MQWPVATSFSGVLTFTRQDEINVKTLQSIFLQNAILWISGINKKNSHKIICARNNMKQD